ncbi:MAG: nitrilase-related carbon-nitrogen hydrolase [Planctomycetota bacterium]
MDCTISMAQIEPTLGDLATNLETHEEIVRREAESGADIVLFPELSLTGYFLKDQVTDAGRTIDAPELEALRKLSKNISIGVGFCEIGREGHYYNSYAFFEDEKLLHVHRKVHLVTYGMFEESRDFAAGNEFRALESKHGRFGVLLCEDAWHAAAGYLYFLAGVDAMFIPSAGPGRGVNREDDALETDEETGLASTRIWNTLTTSMALRFQSYVLYVNRIGFEDGIMFGGGTRCMDPFGDEIDGIEGFHVGVMQTRLRSTALRRARVVTPLRRGDKPHLVQRELKRLAEEGLL